VVSHTPHVVVTASNGDMYVLIPLASFSPLSKWEQICDVSSILLSRIILQMLHWHTIKKEAFCYWFCDKPFINLFIFPNLFGAMNVKKLLHQST
jgi:hypothetical protein